MSKRSGTSGWVYVALACLVLGTAAAGAWLNVSHESLLHTVFPVVGTGTALGLFCLAYYRYWATSTTKAHERFDAAMRTVSDRLGIQHRQATGPLDWAGAHGTYRERHVATFLVSGEGPMQTGISVSMRASPDALAHIKKRRRWKLSVEVPSGADASRASMRESLGERLTALFKQIDEAEITPERMTVMASCKGHNFWMFNMLTDPDALQRAVDAAVDLAVELER